MLLPRRLLLHRGEAALLWCRLTEGRDALLVDEPFHQVTPPLASSDFLCSEALYLILMTAPWFPGSMFIYLASPFYFSSGTVFEFLIDSAALGMRVCVCVCVCVCVRDRDPVSLQCSLVYLDHLPLG